MSDGEDDFEARRLANIRENAALLNKLGLGNAGSNILGITPPAQSTSARPKTPKRKRAPTTARVERAPSRKSARLASSVTAAVAALVSDDDAATTVEDDDQSNNAASSSTVRAPRTPPIPQALPAFSVTQSQSAYTAPLPTRDPCPLRVLVRHHSQPADPSLSSSTSVRAATIEVADASPDVPGDDRDDGSSVLVGGTLRFTDAPDFTPNLTPGEMMRLGSFGGGFFRPVYSTFLQQDMPADYTEFPPEWYAGIDVNELLAKDVYDIDVNHYGVAASQTLADWERAGWIRASDPRGWFQWYARFFLGRRLGEEDERQIKRWRGVASERGRFRNQLIKKVRASGGGEKWRDPDVSAVLRQTLQHWGYILTEDDYLDAT